MTQIYIGDNTDAHTATPMTSWHRCVHIIDTAIYYTNTLVTSWDTMMGDDVMTQTPW